MHADARAGAPVRTRDPVPALVRRLAGGCSGAGWLRGEDGGVDAEGVRDTRPAGAAELLRLRRQLGSGVLGLDEEEVERCQLRWIREGHAGSYLAY
jgi:hypothetical protein